MLLFCVHSLSVHVGVLLVYASRLLVHVHGVSTCGKEKRLHTMLHFMPMFIRKLERMNAKQLQAELVSTLVTSICMAKEIWRFLHMKI